MKTTLPEENRMIRKLLSAMICVFMLMAAGCNADRDVSEPYTDQISYHFASREEGTELMLANTEYYEKFSQNELDYKAGKVNANMEEYLAMARKQVLDFEDGQKNMLSECFKDMEETLKKNHFTLPPLDEIVLITTTMKEEGYPGAYTHGTQIYIWNGYLHSDFDNMEEVQKELVKSRVISVLWHEMFHCLTRCNPDFRKDMYSLIHFTVTDKDYEIPPSVFEYHISNPDVEHHNSYATFHIDGRDIDCFTDYVTTKHFEKNGDTFFDCGITALVPVDGTDTFYTKSQASNFYDIFGRNTDYVIDPEECMADNFSFAMCYGTEGPDKNGYSSPEIIEGILDYLTRK